MPDVKCECGVGPEQSEPDGEGTYTEAGVQMFICGVCWLRENASRGRDPYSDAVRRSLMPNALD